MDGHPQAMVVLFPCSLSQAFKEATIGITLFVLSLLICFLVPWCIARAGALHNRSLSSAARDESRITRYESLMARDEPRMTGDYCWPEESIHRCVCTHSHLYSYIYGLMALLDYIPSGFSSITI
jgi:hypothetical protein